MGKFLTELHVVPVDDSEGGRSVWQLEYPLVYESDTLGTSVAVPDGFLTDFASVPRLPIIYLFMNDVGQKAAVIHDYLYRNGLFTRKLADQTLREALKDIGVSAWRRSLMYAAVRVGGFASYRGQS